jgi:predicted nicotinamide N-methyase
MSKEEEEIEWSEESMKKRPFTSLDTLLEMGGLMYDIESLSVDGKKIAIEDVADSDDDGDYEVTEDTGRRTWEASFVFAKYIELHSQNVLGKDSLVLEVGAGTGVVGIAAAATCKPRRVILTDLEYCHKALRNNVAKSKGTWTDKTRDVQIDVMTLNWKIVAKAGSWDFIPDVILGSEVVWLYELVEPLVETLKVLCDMRIKTKGSPPKIFMAYQSRDEDLDEALRVSFKKHGFRTLLIPHTDLPSDYRFSQKIVILNCVYSVDFS